LLTTPALALIRKSFPETQITYIVGPWCEEVVEHNPNVDQVLTCEFPGFTRRPKGTPWNPYVLLLREARRLRDYEFDTAVNLRFDFWWGALLAYLAGIPNRIGYATPEVEPFLTMAVPYTKGRHEVEQNLSLIRAAYGPGKIAREMNVEFPIQAADQAWATDWLRTANGGKPVVIIHPGAGAPVKLWPAERFARVADTLAEELGASIVLTGSAAEQPLIDAVSYQMTAPAGVLSGAPLGRLGALLEQADLVIGSDSGVLHLAVAAGTPSIHLYGPMDPQTFGPWEDRDRHVVLQATLPCVPCNRLDYSAEELPLHPCMESIAAEQVLRRARELLDRHACVSASTPAER
jgi:heptosyltransferase-2/heptosyltransferase-3